MGKDIEVWDRLGSPFEIWTWKLLNTRLYILKQKFHSNISNQQTIRVIRKKAASQVQNQPKSIMGFNPREEKHTTIQHSTKTNYLNSKES
jgi:hypothetical protein